MLNLIQLQDRLKDLSDRQLAEQMRLGDMPQYLVLSELQRRKKMRQEAQTPDQAPQSTVAEELGQDVMQRVAAEESAQDPAMSAGIAALPVEPPAFAGGGLVSFAGGGDVKPSKRYKSGKSSGKGSALKGPVGPVRNANGETLQQVMKRLGIPDHFAEFPLVNDGTGLGWEIGTRGDSIDGSRVDITTSIPTDPAHFEELRPFVVTPPVDAKRAYGREPVDAAAQSGAGGVPSVTQVIPRFGVTGADASVLPTRAPSAVAPARSGVEALMSAPASSAPTSVVGSEGAEISAPIRSLPSEARVGAPAMDRMPLAAPTGIRALAGAQGAQGTQGAELSNEVYMSEGTPYEGAAELHYNQRRTPTLLEIPGLLPPGYYTEEQMKAILGDSFRASDMLPLAFSGGGAITPWYKRLFGLEPKHQFTGEEEAAAIAAAREAAVQLSQKDREAAAEAYKRAGSYIGPRDKRLYWQLSHAILTAPAAGSDMTEAERAELRDLVAQIPGADKPPAAASGAGKPPAAASGAGKSPTHKSPVPPPSGLSVKPAVPGGPGVNVVPLALPLEAQLHALKMPEYNTDAENALLAQLQSKVDARKDEPLNMAMVQAGLATMAGSSPYALQNIGRGGIAGLETYAASKKELRDLDKEIINAKLGLETAKREGDWKKYTANFNVLDALMRQQDAEKDRKNRLDVAKTAAAAHMASGDRAKEAAKAGYLKLAMDQIVEQLKIVGLPASEVLRLRTEYDNLKDLYAQTVGVPSMPGVSRVPSGAVQRVN